MTSRYYQPVQTPPLSQENGWPMANPDAISNAVVEGVNLR